MTDRFWVRPNADFEMPTNTLLVAPPLLSTSLLFLRRWPRQFFFEDLWGPCIRTQQRWPLSLNQWYSLPLNVYPIPPHSTVHLQPCTAPQKCEYSKTMVHRLADLFSCLDYTCVFLQSDQKGKSTKTRKSKKIGYERGTGKSTITIKKIKRKKDGFQKKE
jgi:hypothetical protein